MTTTTLGPPVDVEAVCVALPRTAVATAQRSPAYPPPAPIATPAPSDATHRTPSRRAAVLKAVAGVVAMVALTAIGLVFFPRALDMVGRWGYLSVLVVETINSATILFPTPGRAITLAHAVILNPWAVGVLAGIGSSIGEVTGYMAGRGGRQSVTANRAMRWIEARMAGRADAVVFLGALAPLPFDVIGVWAGATRYPIVRWFVLMTPAKIIKMVAMALAARYGFAWVLD